MLKDWMTVGGAEYRIAINWNTIEDFLDRKNLSLTDLQQIGNFSGKDITLLIECAAVEGERLEGRECTLTAKDIGEELDPEGVAAFIELFQRRFMDEVSTTADSDGVPAKKKLFFSRK